MKKFFTATLIVLFLSTLSFATVEIKSHTQVIAGTVTLHVYANTISGQGVQAQARYGSPYTYTGFVSGVWYERGNGDSYTNFDVVVSGLPSNGQVDFEASKLNVYGDVSQGGFEYTGFVYTISDVLPVELTTFTAFANQKEIKLNWQTATEVNNYGFDVERKPETGDWKKIGFVEGHGNSNSPKNYAFSDNTAFSGKYFYRLKQIDIDGKFEYSKTEEVTLETQLIFELKQNYPNPFNPKTNIQFSIPEISNISISVYNIIGEKVETLLNKKLEAGLYSIIFDASELNSGIYFYTIKTENFIQTKKMIVAK
ncbi:MAG: T9SS type A sorting domain-containing protein [Ignavibacteriae bacterium]|nr:T9SS type A sorting domain-containing protein [Ignavibacteriota bacterium]